MVPDFDFRVLPKRPELETMLMRVESLGIFCELGLVQRHCGADPLSLFRFGLTPIDGLIAALDEQFAAIDDPELLKIVSANMEWITVDESYGFEFHTDRRVQDISPEAVRKLTAARFKFLAGKIMDDLTWGEKLFFYRPENSGPPGEAGLALLRSMQVYGRAVLCWVDVAPEPALAGTARWLVPGEMMVGYLDRYASLRFAAGASFECWLALVRSSLDLWDATRGA